MKLDPKTFATIVRYTPLVAIDLVVRDGEGRVLLGLRSNHPARDTWFVPGGRILKDERFAAAFQRLTYEELGLNFPFEQARFLGVYEHFYNENFSGVEGFGTHYVTLAYGLVAPMALNSLPGNQHRAYRWWMVEDLLHADEVHPNTKAYFS
jgi:colanic acid biosynthesis protein WcaH